MCLSRCRPAGFSVPWGETRQTFHPIHGRQRASHRSKSLPVAIPQQFLSEIESHFPPRDGEPPAGFSVPWGETRRNFTSPLAVGALSATPRRPDMRVPSALAGDSALRFPLKGGDPPAGEWPGRRVGELNDMRGVLGMGAPEELAAVPGVDQQLDRIAPRAASG